LSDWVGVHALKADKPLKEAFELFQMHCSTQVTRSLVKEPFRRFFTPAEDALILKAYSEHPNRWDYIASFFKGRNPKQIRDRYLNYLAPDLNPGPWTQAEDQLLLKLAAEYQNRWAVIAKYFPGRSPNSLKNRYHRHLKNGPFSSNSPPVKLPPISTALGGAAAFPVFKPFGTDALSLQVFSS